jgi:hypothetical protein
VGEESRSRTPVCELTGEAVGCCVWRNRSKPRQRNAGIAPRLTLRGTDLRKSPLAAAILFACAGTALSQAGPNQPAPNPSAKDQSAQTQSQQPIRQQVQNNLARAGYTDIKIMPESFLVRAKDKSATP